MACLLGFELWTRVSDLFGGVSEVHGEVLHAIPLEVKGAAGGLCYFGWCKACVQCRRTMVKLLVELDGPAERIQWMVPQFFLFTNRPDSLADIFSSKTFSFGCLERFQESMRLPRLLGCASRYVGCCLS